MCLDVFDHKLSVALAFARGNPREIIRAYTLDNLQWLCVDCHKAKTADDVRRISNLRAGRPEDYTESEREPEPVGPRPKPFDPRQANWEDLLEDTLWRPT